MWNWIEMRKDAERNSVMKIRIRENKLHVTGWRSERNQKWRGEEGMRLIPGTSLLSFDMFDVRFTQFLETHKFYFFRWQPTGYLKE